MKCWLISCLYWFSSRYNNDLYAPFINLNSKKLKPSYKKILEGEDLTEDEQVRIVAIHWLQEAAQSLFGNANFMKALFTSRYKPLLLQGSTSALRMALCPPQVSATTKGQLVEHIHLDLEKILDYFKEVESQGIKEIHFGNYVEDVLGIIVPLEEAPLFLDKCFT